MFFLRKTNHDKVQCLISGWYKEIAKTILWIKIIIQSNLITPPRMSRLINVLLSSIVVMLLSSLTQNLSADEISAKIISPRVVGGQYARADQCPWMVLITTEKYTSTGNRWESSSGALLNRYWVITQAEPLRSGTRSYLVMGTNKAFGIDEEYSWFSFAYPWNYHFHPESRSGSVLFNVALVKLALPVDIYTPFVMPISLLQNKSGDTFKRVLNSSCTIFGFGSNCKFFRWIFALFDLLNEINIIFQSLQSSICSRKN